MNNKSRNNSKGSVLTYLLVGMFIASILLVSIVQYITSQIKYGFHNYYKEEAFQIAESGMNFYKWYLAKEMETRTTPQDVLDFWANSDPIGTEHDCDEAGAYVVDYEYSGVSGHYCLEVTPPDEWSTIFTVRSVGWTDREPNTKRTIQVRFRRPSFSEYMIVGNQQFVLNDEAVVHGRLHSNEGISFNGTAYNVVSSEQEDYYYIGGIIGIGAGTKPGVWTYWPGEYNNTLDQDVFQVGKQIGTDDGATHWDFPSANAYIDFARTESQEGINPPEAGDPCNPTGHTFCDSNGCYFTNCGEGQHIIFGGNTMTVCTVNSYCTNAFCTRGFNIFYYGKYSIKNYKMANGGAGTCDSCSGSCASTYTIPTNGAIFVEDNAWVEGTLGTSSNHKRVTVVAADDTDPGKTVFIGRNNITYSSYDGQDIMGLLGENNIEIIRYSQNNLRIDGAVMAKNGRVGRDTYLLDWPNSVTFFGSVISYGRFNVGKGIIPTWDVGYQHVYLNFDNNLLYWPPPFFPTGTGYTVDLWEEL
ncbi:MAG: hypothetical protein A3J76_00130 [Candidatus Moranbacteria bacterium RBG_13_45_13]|nr:MAG: hypothetical protein A3J76_00130 [Candidatus Moranbacteria bacterium RBG_13_45_13]